MVGWSPWLETGDLERTVKHESSLMQEEGDRTFASILPKSGYDQEQTVMLEDFLAACPSQVKLEIPL